MICKIEDGMLRIVCGSLFYFKAGYLIQWDGRGVQIGILKRHNEPYRDFKQWRWSSTFLFGRSAAVGSSKPRFWMARQRY